MDKLIFYLFIDQITETHAAYYIQATHLQTN